MKKAIAKSKREIQKDYEQRTGYAAQQKYNAKNLKRFNIALNYKTDADIIEHLEKQKNKNSYIKELIKSDMTK